MAQQRSRLPPSAATPPPARDPRIDAYIGKAADFARPILDHVRKLVHIGCPDVEETIKWGMPFFVFKGSNLCHMAAFKSHCAFGFWKSELIVGGQKGAPARANEPAMGQFGRITTLADLPDDKTLTRYVKEAAALNEQGIKVPGRAKPAADRELEVPDYFLAALRGNRPALAAFERMSYSNRKEYVDWLTEAKTEATRQRRMETAVEWLAEGKARNWKYLRN